MSCRMLPARRYITPFSIPYLLFSVAIGYFKAWAMLGGLFGSKKSKSWKVTAKKGGVPGDEAATAPTCWQRTREVLTSLGRPYALESGLAVYYGALAGAREYHAVSSGQVALHWAAYC